MSEKISQRQAADLLGVSVKTLKKWTEEKKVPHVKVNNIVRYNKEELEKKIEIVN